MKCFVSRNSLVNEKKKKKQLINFNLYKDFTLVFGCFQIIFQTEVDKKLFEKLDDKLSLKLTGNSQY